MHDHTFTNRIESAFRALAYTHSAEAGGVTMTPHGPRATKPRRLTNAETGLRNNISVGIQYIGAWLAGNGCVPVYKLMEDAATAEISHSQIW